MKTTHLAWVTGLATILLASCSAIFGEEIARIPINEVSSHDNMIMKEVSVELTKDEEIAIWSDMDIEYEGNVELRFKLEIFKDGKLHGQLELDPTEKHVSVNEVKTSINGKTDWRFEGKNTKLRVEEDANYTFKGMLVASDNPTLVVNKAEIVLKR